MTAIGIVCGIVATYLWVAATVVLSKNRKK